MCMRERKINSSVACITVATIIMAANTGFAYEEPKKVLPLNLSELEVNEAIVIDDDDEDIHRPRIS